MIQILDLVQYIGKISLKDAEFVVDGTLGNGHDTLWMIQNAPKAFVYGFDIQSEAIENTTKRLIDANVEMEKVKLIHDSHANMQQYIHEKIDFLLFNFGYLPGGNKTITTQTSSTLSAIEQGLEMLTFNGVAILVVYPGHEEGEKEANAVLAFVSQLPWMKYNVYCYQIMNNTKKPPIAYIIRKSEKN